VAIFHVFTEVETSPWQEAAKKQIRRDG
jgi:hypothetical protein